MTENRRLASVRHPRGGALLTSLAITMVLFITGTSVVALSIQSMRRARLDTLRTRALALADAGISKAVYYIRTTAPDGTTDGSWRTTGRTESVVGQGDYTMSVVNGTGDAAGKLILTATGRAVDGGDATSTSTNMARATKSSIEVRRTVRVIAKLSLEDVSVWNNAIFGGVGQNGQSINGNVLIAGSVHLMGDGETYTDVDGDGHWDNDEPYTDLNHNGKYDLGEPYTDVDGDGHRDAKEPFIDVNGNGVCDPPLTVTNLSSDFGGTAGVQNNYSAMSSQLYNLLPPLPTTTFKGETVQTLSAKFRAKHGYVSLSGSATIGQPQATGGSPAVKETMDGVYVSDGFGGNQGASQVYSDNGTTAKYDLPDGIVTFPNVSAPVTLGGVAYNSYMDYLKANALVLTGPLNLAPNQNMSPQKDKLGNSIQVNGSGTMSINGIIFVNGDININSANGNKQLSYSGRGTLVSTGNIYVHTNLLPTAYNFPIIHALGMISQHNLYLATGSGDSQLELAGAFYAQQQIVSAFQNEIAGTFVSSYYSMTNVPHMFQVPTLPDNLPPGMPGAGRIWVKSVRIDSWRETS